MKLLFNIPVECEEKFEESCKGSREQVLKNINETAPLNDIFSKLIKTGEATVTIKSND